jgi:hypothetical protein
VRHLSDVSSDDAATDGVVEGTPDDEMYLQDALGCQWPLAVLRVKLLVVESFQVVGSEATDRNLPGVGMMWSSILRRYPSQVLCATSSFLPGSHRVSR